MSNAERQRRFRKRNPGYYASLQATRRGSAKRGAEQRLKLLYARAMEAASVSPPLTGQDALSVLIDHHSV